MPLRIFVGKSLAVQWLGLHALTAKGPGSIPSWRMKTPQATWCGKKKKKEYLCFMGRSQNININTSLEEVDSNPHR